jgi:hypothetical protein
MRGITLPSSPSRIKGRASLLRRLRSLLIAAHRFGQYRAVTPAEMMFAGRLVDGLRTTLATVESSTPSGTTATIGRQMATSGGQ